jgi:hypothetical protein
MVVARVRKACREILEYGLVVVLVFAQSAAWHWRNRG